ncbi:MAG: hypothetical protein ACE5F4_02165 [Candidatus Paceibacteria bacterium]
MIQKILQRIKGLAQAARRDIFIIAVIAMVALASFGLGRLSVFYGKRDEFSIVTPSQVEDEPGLVKGVSSGAGEKEGVISKPPLPAPGGAYVASKSGTKYHFPWCSGAQRILNKNRIWFQTRADAEAAGFEPAANCKGLE